MNQYDDTLLASLPINRAREALVLQRRLRLLDLQRGDASLIDFKSLHDVASLEMVMETLDKIQEDEESEQVLRVHFQDSEVAHEEN